MISGRSFPWSELSLVGVVMVIDGRRDSYHALWSVDLQAANLGPLAARDSNPALTKDCAGVECYRVTPGHLRVEESHTTPPVYTP